MAGNLCASSLDAMFQIKYFQEKIWDYLSASARFRKDFDFLNVMSRNFMFTIVTLECIVSSV